MSKEDFASLSQQLGEELDKQRWADIPINVREMGQIRSIVISTSFFLSDVIRDSGRELEKMDISDILARINKGMRSSLIMPSSNFDDPKELVEKYKVYFDIAEANAGFILSENNRLLIAKAYLNEVNKSKQENRYFSRNTEELRSKYGNTGNASLAVLDFLNSYGFQLNQEASNFSSSQPGRDPILDWAYLDDHLTQK